MKKKIHSPLNLIKFHCISCQQEYQTYSTARQDIKVEICGNCVSYDGNYSEIKTGKAEEFRQRQEKTLQKEKK